MPAILDVAIGTVFIFLLFSLVVSALNEYLLSLTDQRAKFLRLGLLELFGIHAARRGVITTVWIGNKDVIRRAINAVLAFLWWLWCSFVTVGGLKHWRKRPVASVNGSDFLAHGLINGLSRSDNGTGTPSYIPAGAFVTVLLDLIVAPGSPAAGLATQATMIDNLITGLRNARPAPGAPLTLAAYRAPLDAFKLAYGQIAPPPTLGTSLAELHDRIESHLARSVAQDAVLVPPPTTLAAAATAIAGITDPILQVELSALHVAAGGVLPAFIASVTTWFSTTDSLNTLEVAALVTAASLVAAHAGLNAARIEAGLQTITNPKLKKALTSLFESANGDVKAFKIAVEGWFNGVMERVGGWYKRFAQKWMIAIGFVLAAIFNVNAIDIVRELSNQPHLARAIASQAETYYGENGRPLTSTEQHIQTGQRLDAFKAAEARLNRLGQTTPGTEEEKTNAAAALTAAEKAQTDLTVAEKADAAKVAAAKQAVEDATANLKYFTDGGEPPVNLLTTARQQYATAKKDADTRAAYENSVARLSESGLPVGWTDEQREKIGLKGWKFDLTASFFGLFDPRHWPGNIVGLFTWLSTHFSTLATLSAGWFITAVAASLGAPFWFDLLGRFVNIRSSGKAPGEKDTTATATRPPAASLDTTPGTRP